MYLVVIVGLALIVAGALYHRYYTDPVRALDRLATALGTPRRVAPVGRYPTTVLLEDVVREAQAKYGKLCYDVRDVLYPRGPDGDDSGFNKLTWLANQKASADVLDALWDEVFFDPTIADETFGDLEDKLLGLMGNLRILEKLRRALGPPPQPQVPSAA